MKARFFTLLAVLAVGLGVLSSCSDAIYATIETEKKVTTNTLPLLMSIFDIETTIPGSTYYVAGGAVFQGVLSGPGGTVGWTPSINDNSRPFNPPGTPICNAMALYGGALWGGFVTSSGNASLWKSDTSYSFGGATAAQVATAIAGEQVTLLKAAGTNLFLGGATAQPGADYVFQLDTSTTPATSWTTVLPALTKPVTGVGFDGVNYWVATGSTLYEASAAGGPYSPVTPVGYNGTDPINSVFADSTHGGLVIVLTKTTGVFYATGTQSAPAWVHVNPDTPSGSANPASYLCAAGPVDNLGPGDLYLVGSDGNNTTGFGYYTLSLSGQNMSRFSDTTILLYASSVSHILVDGGNVLMGTNYNGLWRAVFNQANGQVLSGTNQYWIHE